MINIEIRIAPKKKNRFSEKMKNKMSSDPKSHLGRIKVKQRKAVCRKIGNIPGYLLRWYVLESGILKIYLTYTCVQSFISRY